MNAVSQSIGANEHYENDQRQAMLAMALITFAAFLSAALIVWVLM